MVLENLFEIVTACFTNLYSTSGFFMDLDNLVAILQAINTVIPSLDKCFTRISAELGDKEKLKYSVAVLNSK